MTELTGGCIAPGHEIWTAFVEESGEGRSNEIDLRVPRASSDTDIRADVKPSVLADYMPGL
ncbi:hypothetical protein [Rhodococcus sp. JG-3]|uniref:hypothetical protein n=1 Tax=Rhodococcus sp. JG-3 TaxID=1305835 RepID=UPI00126875AB|nr:hypothetical protein [Rhodococcus sp. JG-3]